MYQCKECHELFDQPGEVQDEYEHQPTACCPYCGSFRFESLPEDDPREER